MTHDNYDPDPFGVLRKWKAEQRWKAQQLESMTLVKLVALLNDSSSLLYEDGHEGRSLTAQGAELARSIGWSVDQDAYGNAFATPGEDKDDDA